MRSMLVCIIFVGVGVVRMSASDWDEGLEDEALWEEESNEELVEGSDPIEGINRLIFRFNDSLYEYVFSPVAEGYAWLVPIAVREAVGNFFYHWAFPVRGVNSVLQGKLEWAAQEMALFIVNSSVGLLGFFDAGQNYFGMEEPPSEDFGQTLGYWGVGPGVYLVLPVIGPTTTRDLVGSLVDGYLTPINYLQDSLRYPLRTEEFLNESPDLIERYRAVKQIALSPYTSLRNAYYQRRSSEVDE